MRFFSVLIASIILLILGQACTERMICPAYQSAFIHDKEALKRQFSYFNEDSTPKVFEASKDRFLIIEPVSYHRKLRSLQTIAMTDVYPVVEEDSAVFDQDEFFLAERDDIDSTLLDQGDSTYVISLKKESFNTEQELYLWYLKDYLVYPDVRLMQEQQLMESREVTEEKVGFFKRLFGKKKNKEDGTEFDVETSATDIDDNLEDTPPEKEGFFKRIFGKKNKTKEPSESEDTENEDDGDSGELPENSDPSTK